MQVCKYLSEGGSKVARIKVDDTIWVSLGSRLKLDTDNRLNKYLKNNNITKQNLLDEAVNDYLDKHEKKEV